MREPHILREGVVITLRDTTQQVFPSYILPTIFKTNDTIQMVEEHFLQQSLINHIVIKEQATAI